MSEGLGKGAVLVVDDDPGVVETLGDWLRAEGYDVSTGHTAAEAVAAVKQGHQGVIFLDLMLPDATGLEIFEVLQSLNPLNRIIVITGEESLDYVVSATRAGAFDFIVKTQDLVDRVFTSTRNAFEALAKERASDLLVDVHQPGPREVDLIAHSTVMRPVTAGIKKLASSRVSVLIQGGSGTGKEVVARAIHSRGPRADKPFVAVNCAGIPDALLESELLGHERGAFTGAVARKVGKFEVAHGGTIFLDEIGEMSLPLQAKILRVVQDGCFERLGGTRLVEVDVRVLSATNRDLTKEVALGNFREDLYYRLAVFTLTVPDLADRVDDIPHLAEHFLREASREERQLSERKQPLTIDDQVMRLFLKHPWPGNVRQLQNVIKHAVVVCDSKKILISHLPDAFTEGMTKAPKEIDKEPVRPEGEGEPERASGVARAVESAPPPSTEHEVLTLDLPRTASAGSVEHRLDICLAHAFPDAELLPTMPQLEAAGIRLAMLRLEGNRKQTASRLQISRATLYRRIDGSGRRGSEPAPVD